MGLHVWFHFTVYVKFPGSFSKRLGFIRVHVDKVYYDIVSIRLLHLMFI